MTTYAEDTFVDTPGTLLTAHTPTGTTPGGAWVRVIDISGTEAIISPSGETRRSTSTAIRHVWRLSRSAGVYPADYTVEADFKWVDGGALQNNQPEIGLRSTNTGTGEGYLLQAWNFGNGSTKMRYRLIRMASFTADVVLAQTGDLTHPDPGSIITCSITAIGSTLRCQAGGIDLFGAVTDTTYSAAGQPFRAGLNLNGDESDTFGTHIGHFVAKTAILSTDTTHLSMITQPAGAETGSALLQQPVVELRDSLDAPVLTAGIVVTASIATGPGVIGGTLTATTNGSGRATYTNLSVTGTGATTLAFSATGLIRAVSNQFNVVGVGKATRLVITQQPGTIAAGDGHRYPTLPLIVEARNNANVIDTTYHTPTNLYSALLSSTRAGGGANRLRGPLEPTFWLGVCKFYGTTLLDPATYTFTASAPDLFAVTSASFVVSAPADTFYPDIDGAALPRILDPIAEPTQTGAIFYVGASDTYTTMGAAIAAYGASTINPGDTIVVRDAYNLAEAVTIPARTPVADGIGGFKWLVIRRETAPTPNVNTRVSPSDFAGRGTWLATDPSHIISFVNGANYVRIQGMRFDARAAADTNTLIDCGFSTLNPPTYNPYYLTTGGQPHHIVLDRLYLRGNPSNAIQSRRAVLLNAAHNVICSSYIEGFRDNSSDAQGVMMFNTAGPARVYNNYIEGQSENFLTGGADANGPQYIPTDITVHYNVLQKPLAYRATLWNNSNEKNLFELKVGHRVLCEYNILQGFWDDGVSQPDAFNLKSVNQSSDPGQDWTGTSNVIIRNNLVRNVASFLGTSGRPQGQCEQMNRLVVRNNVIVNVNAVDFDGTCVALRQNETQDVLFEHNTLISAPGRWGGTPYLFNNYGARRTRIQSNATIAETWLYSAAIGQAAAPNMTSVREVCDPLSIWLNNYIGGFDLAGTPYQEANKIATNIIVAATAGGLAVDPGFTNFGIRTTAETADPDALLAALIPTNASALHNTGHDGFDIGALDIAAIRAGLVGVLVGTPASTPINHLVVTRQPSAAGTTGVALSTQPSVAIQNASNITQTGDVGTVTVTLDVVTGAGALIGVATKAEVAGVADFVANGLGALSPTGGTFRFRLSRAGLPDVFTGVFAITPPSGIVGIAIVRQASGAIERVPFAVQPQVKACLADGSVDTTFTGVITAYKIGGRGKLRGTLTVQCVAGIATWTDLYSTRTAPMLIGYFLSL